MRWRYDVVTDSYACGPLTVSGVELEYMDLAEVLRRCPGLLLAWWKRV